MIQWLRSAIAKHRAPMLEAERIVYAQDQGALSFAAALAANTAAGFEERRYHARVLRIAIEREALMRGVDRRTRDCVLEGWVNRRGSLIR